MTSSISDNYRELSRAEAAVVAAECANAWMNPAIPAMQYDVVEKELHAYRQGMRVAPFDALVACLDKIPARFFNTQRRLLDVGASAGYYREVIGKTGYPIGYTGFDYAPAFKELAEKLYPGIRFDVGDAQALPYADASFDIVLSGCCMLHIFDYPKVLAETVRVASHYILLNKTPVRLDGQTVFYEKDGYGCRMLEIHFGDTELLGLFAKYDLTKIAHADVTRAGEVVYRTYLLSTKSQGERQWETA